jgi:hypothetical protein
MVVLLAAVAAVVGGLVNITHDAVQDIFIAFGGIAAGAAAYGALPPSKKLCAAMVVNMTLPAERL